MEYLIQTGQYFLILASKHMFPGTVKCSQVTHNIMPQMFKGQDERQLYFYIYCTFSNKTAQTSFVKWSISMQEPNNLEDKCKRHFRKWCIFSTTTWVMVSLNLHPLLLTAPTKTAQSKSPPQKSSRAFHNWKTPLLETSLLPICFTWKEFRYQDDKHQ